MLLCVCVLWESEQRTNLIYVCYVFLCLKQREESSTDNMLCVPRFVCRRAAQSISRQIAKFMWANVEFKRIKAITKFLITFLPLESFAMPQTDSLLMTNLFLFWCWCVGFYSSTFLFWFRVKGKNASKNVINFELLQQTEAKRFKWNYVKFRKIHTPALFLEKYFWDIQFVKASLVIPSAKMRHCVNVCCVLN
jgi:hypothetical protein